MLNPSGCSPLWSVVLQLKSPWRDGTTHIVMSPLELMQRLAALVPRPRLHLIRSHGALAQLSMQSGRAAILQAASYSRQKRPRTARGTIRRGLRSREAGTLRRSEAISGRFRGRMVIASGEFSPDSTRLTAVQTTGFMTADWAPVPYALLGRVSGRAIDEMRGINRVVYDASLEAACDDRVGVIESA